jgi:hypothetical protein
MIICYMSCSEATLPRSLTPLFSYYCGLFVSSKNVTTFRIKHMQTLLSNHPGTVSGSILSDTPGWAAQGEYEFFASTFRMNTCKSITKQTTSTPFKINTYEKPGGGGTLPFSYSKILLTRRRFAVWPLALRATTVSSRSQAQRVSPREIREAHPLRCMAQGATRAVPNFGGPLEIHVTFRAPVHVRPC